MKIWIVGKYTHPDPWEFCGAFDDEEKARAACTTAQHFIGPCLLNARTPDQRVDWPGAFFPNAA